ncbi:MAG: hypothetical protein RR086_03885, partial [Clostridia bacterium]
MKGEKMNESKIKKSKVNFSLKSFLAVVTILLSVMILVGILTYVIPTGIYDTEIIDGKEVIIPDTYHPIESVTTLPFYRWFTAPIEAVIWGKGN